MFLFVDLVFDFVFCEESVELFVLVGLCSFVDEEVELIDGVL